MKALLRLLPCFAVLLSCTSCFTTLALTGVVLSNIVPGEKVTLSGRTISQIGNTNQCALMRTDNGDAVCIVYDFGTYQDGKRIRSRFVRAGLYEYESDSWTKLYAPIFIRKKDFNRLWPLAVELDAGRLTRKVPCLYRVITNSIISLHVKFSFCIFAV